MAEQVRWAEWPALAPFPCALISFMHFFVSTFLHFTTFVVSSLMSVLHAGNEVKLSQNLKIPGQKEMDSMVQVVP